MSNYISEAIRTESVDGANKRLADINITTVKEMVENLEYLDAVKKFIYYGKEDIRYNIVAIDKLDIPIKPIDTATIRLLHAGLGMLTEAAEFLLPVLESIIPDRLSGEVPELDIVNLKEELGDSMWYQAIACDALATTFEVEQHRNISKLKLRYPDKFTSDAAINRDLEAERKELENEL